jgi:bifunctional non-homologous end joining protein LigD
MSAIGATSGYQRLRRRSPGEPFRRGFLPFTELTRSQRRLVRLRSLGLHVRHVAHVRTLPKAPKPPAGDSWVHEIKHDGYRLITRRVSDRVSLRTRGGFDWSRRYPRIASSVLNLPVASIVLDGEVAWINKDGISDFGGLNDE